MSIAQSPPNALPAPRSSEASVSPSSSTSTVRAQNTQPGQHSPSLPQSAPDRPGHPAPYCACESTRTVERRRREAPS
ncbi:hypothetical protein B7463_g12562, partial [Scytalidium lignicola]